MLNLIFGLHAYQPPTQKRHVVKKIIKESYEPVLDVINEYSSTFCADMPLSLYKQLPKRVLKKYIEAQFSGNIFDVYSPDYHPILPFVPFEKMNLKVQNDKGIFPPELAFSEKIIPGLERIGYEWTIADETHYVGPMLTRYSIPKINGVNVLLMSRFWQKQVTFNKQDGKNFVDRIVDSHSFKDIDAYVLIWIDWETFGHHVPGSIERFLIPFIKEIENRKDILLTTPIEVIQKIKSFDAKGTIEDGSWSGDLDLWWKKGDPFHETWWKLAYETLKNFPNHPETEKALYSCQCWMWSNGKGDIAKDGLEIFRRIWKKHELIDRLSSL